MRILIVDDNPTNILVVREILKRENYQDIVDAASAFGMFQRLGIKGNEEDTNLITSDIDLILLDMMMPEIDGIEACRILQRYEKLKDIPVIMVTAIGDSRKLAEALDAGAVDYVTKPINKVELMARIRLAIRLKEEKDWHKERDQRIQAELQLAALVQNAVLSSPLQESGIAIDAIYKPSFELAGDLYSWYPLGEGKYGVILLDIMGHGISSSLFCMFIASLLKGIMSSFVQPDQVISELNRRFNQLHIDNQLIQYYFTAIYLLVDTKNQRIDYVNAGHPPGLFYQDGTVTRLETVCPPVGLLDKLEAETQTLYYEGEGRVVLYTDGLVEGLAGTSEQQFEFLEKTLLDRPHYDREKMESLLFTDDSSGEREDDKCLVWISLIGGEM